MESRLIENRHIRVFISSTFQDMQDERNYLLIHIFPRLRLLAAERNVTLTEVDLRWGISEEESKTGKVVEICLSEIDNCVPFFIGVIGYRYGWIPGKKDIHDSPNMKDRFKWVYADLDAKLSVTEMEMQYGVLRRTEPTNAFFYIKSAGEEQYEYDYPEKLAQLISSVKQNGRYPVRSYYSVEDLGQFVEKDFIELLDRLFPADDLSPHETERKKQHVIIRHYQQCYVPMKEDIARLDTFLSGDYDCLTVTGGSGSGKSALLANWADLISRDDRYYTLYYSTGSQGEDVLDYWVNELRRLRGLPGIESDNNERVADTISDEIAKSDRPVILILDDVSRYQLCDNWRINTLSWLPVTKNGSKTILASSVSKYSHPKYWRDENGIKEDSMEVSPLCQEDIKEIVRRYLKDYGKKLPVEQIEKIASFPLSRNAGILTMLLEVLVYYGSFETLNEFMDSFLDASNKEDFYDRYLSHIEQHFAAGLVEKVLMMMTLPLYGLKETEIRDHLHLNALTWFEVYSLLSMSLCWSNGCLRVSSLDLERAIMARYQNHMYDHRIALATYLEKMLDGQLCMSEKERFWDELLNIYYTLGQDGRIEEEMANKTFRLISDPNVMWYLTTKRASKLVAINGEGKQIYKYWNWLRDVDSQEYSLTTYLNCGLTDEQFFYRSSAFCDIAAHVGDTIAEAAFSARAIDLYRSGMRPRKGEEEYFQATVLFLSSAAYTWNLLEVSEKVRLLYETYRDHRVLPGITEYEGVMRSLISAFTARDINQSLSYFDKAIETVDKLGDGFRMDKAMALFQMTIVRRSSMPEKSLQFINDAIELSGSREDQEAEVEETDDSYDDHTECVKAEMLGIKGLILEDLKRYKEAYDSVMAAIIRYEDIEDMRIAHGSFLSTIDKVQNWGWKLDMLAEMIDSEDEESENM